MTREVARVRKSTPVIEGAGVHLRRAFGRSQVPSFDPFLLLDDFRGDDPELYGMGFPWHPHRGIETITYVLEGEVEHGDSLGNSGVISGGDVQWMTAGSGIVHQEMPRGNRSGRLSGFQLWTNLPAASKMIDPRYREITARDIPLVTGVDGVETRLICGSLGDTRGPVTDVVSNPSYMDVTVPPGTVHSHLVEPGQTVIAYVIGGRGLFGEEPDPYRWDAEGRGWMDLERDLWCGDTTLVLFGDGDRVRVTTGEEQVRFLLLSGHPIGEPVAWFGPIVMNTKEELKTAFEEYERGTFIGTRGQGAT